jgi:hypothetical protein
MILFTYLCSRICLLLNTPAPVGTTSFWDSKPELFSNIVCLRIPYPPCIALFGNFFSGTTASNRRELRLHLNVVPTGAGVFKSRHILLHKSNFYRKHPCEHSRINILQWILTKLGTCLVLRRVWNPIDFQGQRSRYK